MADENRHQLTYIDLFAGIGGIRIPFDELGCECVFSSELNEEARRAYALNYGETPAGDITKIPVEDIPTHDILLAGFPCQPFSIMGKGKGFADTRGTLFFEIERILRTRRPRAFLLENVKRLVRHDGGRTLQTILERLGALGYGVKWNVLNALDFGLPQKRERILIVGFLNGLADAFDFSFERMPYSLADVLEPDDTVDSSLQASDYIRTKRLEQVRTQGTSIFSPSVWHENKSGHVSVLDHSCALRNGASHSYLLVNGVRHFTAREMLRLQGFPESWKIAGSVQDVRRQTGNSVAVPMIRMVARKIVRLLNGMEAAHGQATAA